MQLAAPTVIAMAKILLAASPEPRAIIESILKEHELFCAETMSEAERLLRYGVFDLIVCTIVFDESRMFDFLRLVKSNRKWKRIPFICALVRPKVMDYPLALEGVQIASQALGAAAFLDINTYEIDPEQEILKDFERFLPQ